MNVSRCVHSKGAAVIEMPRNLDLPDGCLDGLPPVEEIDCLRTSEPLTIDGRLDEAA